jgi:hypothetical protein
MLPDEGVSSPPSRFISVDLPEPESRDAHELAAIYRGVALRRANTSTA